MPRGVYTRSQGAAAAVLAPEVTETSAKSLVDEALQNVAKLAETIKSSHARIGNTVMEIGKNFYSIRQIFDSVPDEIRRVHKVPSFTAWMNKTAPSACGMSDRTVWHYYRNYTEAIASGLKPETVIALAPNVLKNEKPRKAMLTVLSKNPELVSRLNEAAAKPAQLRRLAESPEVREIVQSIEQPAEQKSRAERVENFLVAAYKSVFLVDKESFDANLANAALAELHSVLQRVSIRLGFHSHLSVSITSWTHGSRTPIEIAGEQEEPNEETPQTVQALVDRLSAMGYRLPRA